MPLTHRPPRPASTQAHPDLIPPHLTHLVSPHPTPPIPGRPWVKSEGVVEGVQLQDILSLWKEGDLYSEWVPRYNRVVALQSVGRKFWYNRVGCPTECW